MAVIILVVLAIGIGVSPFMSSRICPVVASSKIAAPEAIAGGDPLTVRIGSGVGEGVGVGGIVVGEGVAVGEPFVNAVNKGAPNGVNASTGTITPKLITSTTTIIIRIRRRLINFTATLLL